MTKALIVVDVQNDFCPGGTLAVSGGHDVARKTARLLLDGDYPVVALTQDWHINPGEHFALTSDPDYIRTWPVHCVAGTRGAEIHPDVRSAITGIRDYQDVTVETFAKGQYRSSYSGFDGTNTFGVPLNIWLRSQQVDAVDIIGLAFDYCVKATALSAVGAGYRVRVLRSVTAAVHPESNYKVGHELSLKGIEVVA